MIRSNRQGQEGRERALREGIWTYENEEFLFGVYKNDHLSKYAAYTMWNLCHVDRTIRAKYLC